MVVAEGAAEPDPCGAACIDALAWGNRLPSGRSTNLEAASPALATGSALAFGEYVGSTTTKSFAVATGTSCCTEAVAGAAATAGNAFDGAGAACADSAGTPSFNVSFWPGPGTSSYLQGRSRS